MKQLDLFGEEVMTRRKKPMGGSSNPIVFKDYDSFMAKFTEGNAKTTDDCYTPKDVYEAVVEYVGTICDMKGKMILRSFFPNGDYLNAEYPEDGIVIDNPPFSMFTKIVRFFTAQDIPFFLFGPGMTIASCCKYCTAVIVAEQITFDNGAQIRCNFASNLYGDTMITTAPLLGDLLACCPSQKPRNPLPSFEYPEEVLSVSDMQTIARNGEVFSVSRSEAVIIKDLDLHPKRGGLFGDHFLLSEAKANEKQRAKERVKEKAMRGIPISLSEREKRMIAKLG